MCIAISTELQLRRKTSHTKNSPTRNMCRCPWAAVQLCAAVADTGGVKWRVTLACCSGAAAAPACGSKYHCCKAITAAVSNIPGGTDFTTFTLLGTPEVPTSKLRVTAPATGAVSSTSG